MKLEFAVVFAQLQRDLEDARASGASRQLADKQRVDAQSSQLLHASPKRVTSSTANLEEIPPPEKVTAGDARDT